MIKRHQLQTVINKLAQFPAVALLGPRQVGKTTLAKQVAATGNSVFLDLESPNDRQKLAHTEVYLNEHRDKLIVLDEIQYIPELFSVLRVQIDRRISEGRPAGHFLILGSADMNLLKQTSQSLAGRISFVELSPFDALETGADTKDSLWVRGGFPRSYLAADDDASTSWRKDFIRTYLERDIPQLGPHVPAETLQRFWTMLAHTQGQRLNAAKLAGSLGVDNTTIARYLDLMIDLLLVRRLQPYSTNTGKRLVKSPKVYIRDSGLVHTLLRLDDKEDVLGHPKAGDSWEGFAIESIIRCAPERAKASFYRTSEGAEIDLLLELPKRGLWAVEIKFSLGTETAARFSPCTQGRKSETLLRGLFRK